MAKPKAFNTYLDNRNKLEMLTDEQAGRLYKSLCAYAVTGEYPDFGDDALLQYAFVDFSSQIDRDFEKYNDMVEKRRESGKKGGAPTGNDNAKQAKQANGCLNKQNKQMVKKTSKTSEEEKEEEKEEEDKKESTKEKSFSLAVRDRFNEICVDLPKVKTITDSRRKRIHRAREMLGDVSFDDLFRKVNASDFLSGRQKDWVASFDWILKPENLTKIIEGNFDNKKPKGVYSVSGASFDVKKYEESGLFND